MKAKVLRWIVYRNQWCDSNREKLESYFSKKYNTVCWIADCKVFAFNETTLEWDEENVFKSLLRTLWK